MEPSSSMEDSKDADAMMESSSIAHSPKEADGRMESSFDIDHTPKDADVKMEPSPIMEHSSHDADVRLKSSSSIAHTPKEADTRMESSSSLDHISKDADVTITSSSTIDHTPKETDARMPSSSNIDHSPKEAEKIMKSSSSIDQAPKDADVDDDVMWADLPTVLLENIYSMLTMRQRFNCSLVCSNWNDVLLAPSLWRTLEVSLAMLCPCEVVCSVQLVQISQNLVSLIALAQHCSEQLFCIVVRTVPCLETSMILSRVTVHVFYCSH